MIHAVAVCSMVLYVVVTVLHLLQLWRPSRTGRISGATRFAFYAAFILHTVTMGLVLRDVSFFVMDNGADYFLWVSWLMALSFVTFRRRLEYPIVGAFVVPAVVLFMGSSSYLLHLETTAILEGGSVDPRQSVWLSVLHGVPALLSVVSLALALVVSGIFLIVERRLKRRRGELLNEGAPNLQLLDMLNRQLIQAGFVAISLVIVSGGLWAVSEQKPVFSLDSSIISGLCVWVLLAFILHARLVLRWSPRQVSKLTVIVTGSFFVSVFLVVVVAGRITHASLWS